MLTLNTNIASLFAAQQLNNSSQALQKVQERLASGKRINNAADDPTGLVTATNYDTQIRGTNAALNGVKNAISTAKINDGYASQILANLQRLNEIATAGGGTAAGPEATALIAENSRIAGKTTATGTVTVDASGGTIAGVGVAITAPTGATTATIQADITTLTTARANYGADMSRFASAQKTMEIASTNLSAAYSLIMDTNYAQDSAEQARLTVLQQAGTAMLAQSNQVPNSVLTLLR